MADYPEVAFVEAIARAQKALSLGCDLVGSQAEPKGPSATNLERMGLRLIGQRSQYKYEPRAGT